MINLYNILQNLLTESVTSDKVIDSIQNRYRVIIKYSDEKNRAPEKRLIEPYVYGISKAGNPVLRAYQWQGDSYRGRPKWKFFRLDRITSWTPTDRHFNMQPKDRGWRSKPYNENGDDLMISVLSAVDFKHQIGVSSAQTNTAVTSGTTPTYTPPQTNLPTTSLNTPPSQDATAQSNDKLRDLIKRNLDITRQEKAKRNRDALGRKLNLDKDTQDMVSQMNNNLNLNTTTTEPQVDTDTSVDFDDTASLRDLINRNLNITQKEKSKRNRDALGRKLNLDKDAQDMISQMKNNK